MGATSLIMIAWPNWMRERPFSSTVSNRSVISNGVPLALPAGSNAANSSRSGAFVTNAISIYTPLSCVGKLLQMGRDHRTSAFFPAHGPVAALPPGPHRPARPRSRSDTRLATCALHTDPVPRRLWFAHSPLQSASGCLSPVPLRARSSGPDHWLGSTLAGSDPTSCAGSGPIVPAGSLPLSLQATAARPTRRAVALCCPPRQRAPPRPLLARAPLRAPPAAAAPAPRPCASQAPLIHSSSAAHQARGAVRRSRRPYRPPPSQPELPPQRRVPASAGPALPW